MNSFPEERSHFNPWLYLNVIFLSILCCMHFLWFYMFQRINLMIIRKVNKGRIKQDEMCISPLEENES